MIQKRLISKTISLSKKISKISDFAALLFTWLIPHCDDYGHMDRSAEMVKAIVMPLRECSVDSIEAALKEMENNELIVRYMVDETPYLEIVKWYDFQEFLKTWRNKVARYPMPPWSQDVGQAELMDIAFTPPVKFPKEGTEIKNNKEDQKVAQETIQQIYEFYKVKINKAARYTQVAFEKIRNRLRKFPPEDLEIAMTNFSQNAWWMEHNSDKGIAWFFSSDRRIDMFLSLDPTKNKKVEEAEVIKL